MITISVLNICIFAEYDPEGEIQIWGIGEEW